MPDYGFNFTRTFNCETPEKALALAEQWAEKSRCKLVRDEDEPVVSEEGKDEDSEDSPPESDDSSSTSELTEDDDDFAPAAT